MENSQIEKLNQGNIEKVKELLKSKNCEFNEESIDFVLNGLNKSFEETIEYSDEHLKIILMCGLPSRSRKEALEMMGEMRRAGITYREFHTILVIILRSEHFFMGEVNRELFLNLLTMLMK